MNFSEKCKDYESDDRRIHCQIQEVKKIQIKDVILSHVGDVDRSAVRRMNHERILKEIEKRKHIMEVGGGLIADFFKSVL